MAITRTITVQDTTISVLLNLNQNDYISLTDMTKNFEDGSRLIEKWLNNKSTIDFLGVWEQLNNPDFKTPEFGGIRMEAGSNRFYMSVNKFIERTGAIGMLAAKGLNLRDTASINQLIVLSNMEVVNAELIKRGVERTERFAFLQQMAIDELQSLNKTNVEQQFKRLATKYPPALQE